MGDQDDKPKLFSNRILLLMCQHMLADGVEMEAKDFAALTMAFHHLGGSWEGVTQGRQKDLKLLQNVITAWGSTPHAQKPEEFV